MKLADLGPDICLDCGRDTSRCRCAELDDPPDDVDDAQRVRIEPGDLGPDDERWAQP